MYLPFWLLTFASPNPKSLVTPVLKSISPFYVLFHQKHVQCCLLRSAISQKRNTWKAHVFHRVTVGGNNQILAVITCDTSTPVRGRVQLWKTNDTLMQESVTETADLLLVLSSIVIVIWAPVFQPRGGLFFSPQSAANTVDRQPLLPDSTSQWSLTAVNETLWFSHPIKHHRRSKANIRHGWSFLDKLVGKMPCVCKFFSVV